jgi:hypothetical protein
MTSIACLARLISSTALSQDLADTMLALSAAYQTNDQTEVDRLLASPIFDGAAG